MTLTRTELAATWPPTAKVAAQAGHKQKSPMRAIREKCLDCCCQQPSEVRACESVFCSLWPFRAGQHPYTSAKREIGSQERDFNENGPATAPTVPSHGPIEI
jgi:hypothetical protein